MLVAGTRVRVYRNLTRRCFSVQQHVGLGWRVVTHAEEILLGQVEMTVRQTGRNRAQRENQRNVHAWLEGELLDLKGAHEPPLVFEPNPKRCPDRKSWHPADIRSLHYDSFGFSPRFLGRSTTGELLAVNRAQYAWLHKTQGAQILHGAWLEGPTP